MRSFEATTYLHNANVQAEHPQFNRRNLFLAKFMPQHEDLSPLTYPKIHCSELILLNCQTVRASRPQRAIGSTSVQTVRHFRTNPLIKGRTISPGLQGLVHDGNHAIDDSGEGEGIVQRMEHLLARLAVPVTPTRLCTRQRLVSTESGHRDDCAAARKLRLQGHLVRRLVEAPPPHPPIARTKTLFARGVVFHLVRLESRRFRGSQRSLLEEFTFGGLANEG